MQQAQVPHASGASNGKWPIAGILFGGIFLGVICAIVAMVVLTTRSLKPSELASVLARPLVPEGVIEPIVNESEMYAALSSKLADAGRMASGRGELALVAREYQEALNSIRALILEAPSAQPLVRAGLDTWQGSLENSSQGFLLGLLGVGSELSKLSEYAEKWSTVHARVVACRLRVAEIAAIQSVAESTTPVVSASFAESRGAGTVASDTISLRNVSGARLSNAMVVTELTGRSGERFSNLYFVRTWEPDQVMWAVCRSESPGRETVRNVMQVKCRVIADERTSAVITFQYGKQ